MRVLLRLGALAGIVGSALAAIAAGHGPPSMAPPAALRPLANARAATARFGFELFAHLARTPGNACLSPLSVEMALAVAADGAAGATAEEMRSTLHLDANADAGFAALRHRLALSDTAYELTIANALWADESTSFDFRYLARVGPAFGAHVERVRFAAPERACATINAWASTQTRGRIPALLSPAALSAATRLVITNAVYFRGRWAHAFERSATSDEKFTSRPGAAARAPFMHATRSYGYAQYADAQVLKLPYAGGSLCMLVILPRAAVGLAHVERTIGPDVVSRWWSGLQRHDVEVHLPKFRLEVESSLERDLPALGMHDAFDPKRADFSGIDGQRDLFIGAVRHRTFVQVDEQGTTAAAATGVMMPTALVRPVEPPVVFRADHPFLFVILDERTGATLFVGRVADPKS